MKKILLFLFILPYLGYTQTLGSDKIISSNANNSSAKNVLIDSITAYDARNLGNQAIIGSLSDTILVTNAGVIKKLVGDAKINGVRVGTGGGNLTTNTVVGNNAGTNNTSGAYNSFIGLNTGQNNTIGNYNSFIGVQAGYYNTTGQQNTFVGVNAGQYGTTGGFNTFIGVNAGQNNISGSNNLYLGWRAGYNNIAGISNTYLGVANIGVTNEPYRSNMLALGTLNNGTYIFGDSTGSIGIGNTTPSYKLDVSGTARISSVLALNSILTLNNTQNIQWFDNGGTARNMFSFDVANALNINRNGIGIVQSFGQHQFYNAAITNVNMSILDAGNVGIGTTTPAYKLDVNGTARISSLGTGASTDLIVTSASGVLRTQTASQILNGSAWSLLGNSGTTAGTNFIGTTDATDLVFKTNNTEKLRVLSGGNVGIGITAPIAKLDIAGTFRTNNGLGDNYLPYSDNNNYLRAYNNIFADQNANEIMRTAGSTGNVGIGTTSPAYKLDVNGTTRLNNTVNISPSGGVEADSILTLNSANNITKRSYTDLGNTILKYSNYYNTAFSVFGQSQFNNRDLNNVLWKADQRFTCTGNANYAFFDQSFDSNNGVAAGDSIAITMPIAIYSSGDLYISYYYTSTPTIPPTAQYVANSQGGGAVPIRYTLSPAVNVSNNSSFIVHKISGFGAAYITKLIITFPAACQVADISYIATRFSDNYSQEPPYFSKYLGANNYYGNINFNIAGIQNINSSIGGGGNSYFNVLGGNLGIGISSPAYKLDVSNDARFNGIVVGRGNSGSNTNTVVGGGGSGSVITTGIYNTFLGLSSGLSNTIGQQNTFLGVNTGYQCISGTNNSFIGVNAGFNNYSGTNNTFLGVTAGLNSNGNNNVFLGYQAGYSNNTASNNSFIGVAAGYSNTSGSNNLYLGNNAGGINISGSSNTYLGVQSTGVTNGSSRSNMLAIGTYSNGTYIFGDSLKNVGIGTTTPTNKLSVAGDIGTTDSIRVNNGGEPKDIYMYSSNQNYNNTINGVYTNPINSLKMGWYGNYWSLNSYRSASTPLGDFGISNGTSDLLRIQSSTGNVGIGINNPAYKLDVSGTGRFTGHLYTSSFGTTDLNAVNLKMNNIPMLTLNADSSIIIGNNGSSFKLSKLLNSSYIGDGLFGATATPNYFQNNYSGGKLLIGYSDGGSGQYTPRLGTQYPNGSGGVQKNSFGSTYDGAFTVGLGYNNAERLRIDSFGNVGIGTTSPAYKLDVSADARFNGVLVGRGGGNISSNTAVGVTALNNNTGNYNTAVGYQAGYNNTSGSGNTSLGLNAGVGNTIGGGNTNLGRGAGQNNVNGGNNVFVGGLSGLSSLGNNNTFLGQNSGNNSTASYNTLVGNNSGGNIISGQGNTYLGVQSTGVANEAYRSNMLAIGTGVNGAYIVGDSTGAIGIGTTSPAYKLDVSGTGRFTGNVGIGTAPTSNALEVNGNVNVNSGTIAISSGQYLSYGTGTINGFIGTGTLLTGGATSDFAIRATNNIAFGIGSSQKMTLAPNGYLGIGTVTPAYVLDVSATANPLRLQGLQTGALTDDILSSSSGVVRKLSIAQIANPIKAYVDIQGTAGTSVTSATQTVVTWNSATKDSLSNFSGTNTFTATNSGVYQVNTTLETAVTWTVAGYTGIFAKVTKVNGSSTAILIGANTIPVAMSNANPTFCNGTYSVFMDAGSTLQILFFQNSGNTCTLGSGGSLSNLSIKQL